MIQPEKYIFKVDGYEVTMVPNNALQSCCGDTLILDVNALKSRMGPLPHIPGAPVATTERDPEYYLDMVEIEVQDVVYSAPRAFLPFPVLQERDARPLCFTTISRQEAEAIFSFFLSASTLELSGSTLSLSGEQWIQVLHCSALWDFQNYRAIAISHLNGLALSDLERLALGRKYSIKEWVKLAYNSLADRTPSNEELLALDLSFSTRLMHLRDKRQLHQHSKRIATGRNQGFITGTAPIRKKKGKLSPTLSDVVKEISHSMWPTGVGHDLLVAKEDGVLEWLQISFQNLINRPKPLSIDEVVAFDLSRQCLLDISHGREHRLNRGHNGWIPNQHSLAPGPFEEKALDTFVADSGLQLKSVGPAERAVLAIKRGHLPWLTDACKELMTREDSITLEEAETLGTANYFSIARGRDKNRTSHLTLPPLSPEELSQIDQWAEEDMCLHQGDGRMEIGKAWEVSERLQKDT